MAKTVFVAKGKSSYDDLPEERYHFPRTYLRAARSAVGDWIVYYEPRRTSTDLSSSGGRQSYFATARVTEIERDPRQPGHYYAFVADYLEFDDPVPFRDGESYFESRLQRDGRTSAGWFRRAVRPLEGHEFAQILQRGFASLSESLASDRVREREVVYSVSQRRFRDRAFSTAIRRHYGGTCAFSGLRIVNGGGRPEVQAAHIRPVADRGPDSVRNGLALSSTFHWMFDRGLISVNDDYSLLLKRSAIPSRVLSLVNRDGTLRLPSRPAYRPHRRFLAYHRERIYKG